MSTQKSIEEIVEEFEYHFVIPDMYDSSKEELCSDASPAREWLRTTLQSERDRAEEEKRKEKRHVLKMIIKKGKAYMVPTGAGSQSEGEWGIGFKQGIYEMMMWANETLEKDALTTPQDN